MTTAAEIAGDADATIERTAFLEAMSRSVTGVNIITTDGAAGRFGVTVSAAASVSADPPMVLACVKRTSTTATAIKSNGVFCLNLLADHQTLLSDIFSGRAAPGDRFTTSGDIWRSAPSGAAELKGAVAAFDCELESAIDAGSHTIFVGRVRAVASGDDAPLAYCRRAYCTASTLASA